MLTGDVAAAGLEEFGEDDRAGNHKQSLRNEQIGHASRGRLLVMYQPTEQVFGTSLVAGQLVP